MLEKPHGIFTGCGEYAVNACCEHACSRDVHSIFTSYSQEKPWSVREVNKSYAKRGNIRPKGTEMYAVFKEIN